MCGSITGVIDTRYANDDEKYNNLDARSFEGRAIAVIDIATQLKEAVTCTITDVSMIVFNLLQPGFYLVYGVGMTAFSGIKWLCNMGCVKLPSLTELILAPFVYAGGHCLHLTATLLYQSWVIIGNIVGIIIPEIGRQARILGRQARILVHQARILK